MKEGPMRVYARIDLRAIAHNFEMMHQKLAPGVMLCAVVKTDGYGHGAIPVARLAEKYPWVWGFAAATAQEAVTLREEGIRKPILILGYVFEEDHEALVRLDLRPAVFDADTARSLSREALRQGKVLPVHIAVDTGMSRIGVKDNESGIEEVLSIAKQGGLRIEGIFTHFARADEKDKSNALGCAGRFRRFTDALNERGLQIPIRHCSNSAGILEIPEVQMDMVRAGITIYGIYPSDEMDREANHLEPAMELISHVSFVKTIEEGTSVSYGGTFTADRQMQVATIPVGYGDGYPRSLSSRGCVLIGGKRCPILGRVCMDQFMVDVTGMDVKRGDEAVLMGRSKDAFLGVDELGECSGRFPYEFVCDIGKRVPRTYILDE